MDCGVSAVVFAATLASGGYPGANSYNQRDMRCHLANGLGNNVFTPFPVKQMVRNFVPVLFWSILPCSISCPVPFSVSCLVLVFACITNLVLFLSVSVLCLHLNVSSFVPNLVLVFMQPALLLSCLHTNLHLAYLKMN